MNAVTVIDITEDQITRREIPPPPEWPEIVCLTLPSGNPIYRTWRGEEEFTLWFIRGGAYPDRFYPHFFRGKRSSLGPLGIGPMPVWDDAELIDIFVVQLMEALL